MVTILSHQWLKLNATGLEASQSRSVRTEERELLQALRAAPVRVVDLFRRLRVTDGQAFQDVLGKAASRGWIEVHDTNPAEEKAPVAESEAPPLSSEDALGALLAKYAQEQEHVSEVAGVVTPEWEKPESLSEPDDVLSFPVSPDPFGPSSEGMSGPSVTPVTTVPTVHVAPSPEDADALFAAMGLDPEEATSLEPAPSRPESAPREAPSLGSNQALLEALAASAPSSPSSVSVPEYGLQASTPLDTSDKDDGFVRLRDVGEGFGEGGGSEDPSNPISPPARPAPDRDDDDPTTRTRHRRSARERMLEAARREEAERQAARERAREARERRAAEEEALRQKIASQRAQEEMARGPSFLSRAEKARRIRDGLPPNSD